MTNQRQGQHQMAIGSPIYQWSSKQAQRQRQHQGQPVQEKNKMLDLEPIKARMETVAKGPWKVEDERTAWITDDYDLGVAKVWFNDTLKTEISLANMVFIAHARTDIPALVAEVETLRKALAIMMTLNQINRTTIELSHDAPPTP